ncbi:MAG: sigma-70 family RNA polymerase sigma factor [Spirochaetes bacterium]|nr:sigma-70 family RNA polymerase sigma factor [Spirochaetota bacterium]
MVPQEMGPECTETQAGTGGLFTGDPAAPRTLWKRFGRLIHSQIHAVLPDPEDRQEVANEVLFKIVSQLGRFNPQKARLSTWIRRLSRNHALNTLRALRRRPSPLPLDDEYPASGDFAVEILHGLSSNTPGASLGQGNNAVMREMELLQAALSRLSARDQGLLLRRQEGVSFSELGEEFGMSGGAARVAYFRAMRVVREGCGVGG